MKVGILSMQRVPNYGSWLQAYALKQLLLVNGADEVGFIDIEPGIILVSESIPCRIKRFLKDLRLMGIRGKIITRNHGKTLAPLFEKFYKQLDPNGGVDVSACDAVVIGSDEVFNAVQNSSWGYTPQLYGKMDCSYVFSYAGSFGHTTIKQLFQYGIAEEISHHLKALKNISVRDRNSYEIIKELTGNIPTMHLDPVLIYGYQSEISKMQSVKYEDYILIYSYEGRIRSKKEVAEIKSYALKYKLRIISLFCSYSWCDSEFVPNSPLDIFDYFKNASYVVTDTFHGSIFSIITHSRFCTLLRSSNMQKLTSLLSMLHLSDRLVSHYSQLGEKLMRNIDYQLTEEALRNYRLEAAVYLQKNLERAKEMRMEV
ncbi:Polysaccharide pyruvyl transferase [Bacteroides faecichinchillae]|uniref:Polysaccharide pyruvyl transferase n=2 Tax=Bacteroides faecichinchillae TaxID=871325 RepID=A0A1M5B975_9BACE|nr:polysaccharide pyruvyl transferase family protein [Bacteroides faecichinchillae]THG67518.1 polysaccharide pyruvyl transferase family protein [Bacteroides faecichinchillae]SHF38970.1 Polysaccharide pyruvyl transferase [Bacteroides faecichinchillae]